MEQSPTVSAVSCRCGCVPANMLSLFEMSALREKNKSQNKKFKKALSVLIDKHTSSVIDFASKSVLDLHDQNLSSCHLFFDNFLSLSDCLTVLHLDHNDLNFIPGGILKSLLLLEELSLHNNKLEVLPSEIGLLSRLEILRLDFNALSSLPVELKNCASLTTLHLTGNPNLAHIPIEMFEHMHHLHHILADKCPKLLSFPPSLQHCEVLEFVTVDQTCLSPPALVLAGGHTPILQFFQHADSSLPSWTPPSILLTDTHRFHRDNALRYLELKRAARMTGTDRCEACWHVSSLCICRLLPRVALADGIELVVYMDSKEVFNSGDDAKLLSISCPSQTKRFIYAAEDAELAAYITSEQTRRSPMCQAVVLFPSSRAISSDEFMAELRQRQCRAQDGAASIGSEAGGDDSAQKLDKSAEHRVPTTSSSTKLIIIVVDAVWRHARRMSQRLHVLLPEVPHVQLSPEQFSVYARKQSQPDRICTVEATALFLSHINGASRDACEQLVECVRINNTAVCPPPVPRPGLSGQSTTTPPIRVPGVREVRRAAATCGLAGESSSQTSRCALLYTKDIAATHPCWYYGAQFFHEREMKAKQVKAVGSQKQKRRYL